MQDYRALISIDPEMMMGKPCMAGTRLTVELILEHLALGYSIEELMDRYPRLTREGVYAALAFATDRIHADYEQAVL